MTGIGPASQAGDILLVPRCRRLHHYTAVRQLWCQRFKKPCPLFIFPPVHFPITRCPYSLQSRVDINDSLFNRGLKSSANILSVQAVRATQRKSGRFHLSDRLGVDDVLMAFTAVGKSDKLLSSSLYLRRPRPETCLRCLALTARA